MLALETHINTVSASGAALSLAVSAQGTIIDTNKNTLSARLVSVSSELVSLFTSVDNKLSASIQVASGAATSADAHANTVSARVVSVSAELASLLASTSAQLRADITSVAGLVGGSSITSNEVSVLVQTASAAATSADAHANTVSARVVSVSAELMSQLASTSAALESHINAVSAAGVTGGASVTSTELSAAKYMLNTTQTDTDYTVSIGDARTTVKMNSASPHDFTIPLNATVAFPVGTQIIVEQAGTGAVTIVPTGGVTLQGGPLTLTDQYATAVLIKQATDTWLVGGAIDVTSIVDVVSARVVSVSARTCFISPDC